MLSDPRHKKNDKTEQETLNIKPSLSQVCSFSDNVSNLMIGAVLGDNKEWDCCQQHSQGFHFSRPTGNEIDFEFQFVLLEKK